MKRVGFIIFALVVSLSVTFAQKIAVLDFKAGVGISQTDVDGLSSTFVTYFNPRGYQLVERSQINQVIEEQGFQQTSLTESQMVRLGQILNLSKIVVGDVNIIAGSPNLDVRVIDVQSGEVTGRDGATFAWTNYRATMQQLAQKVAGQIAVVYGGSDVRPTGKSPSGKVETILGYLQVYPEDLGSFNVAPTSVIAAVNRQKLNGFEDWRLPTNEELSLMANAKDKLGIGNISGYMSSEDAISGGMKTVRLVRSDDFSGNNRNHEGSIKIRVRPLQDKTYTISTKSNTIMMMDVQGQTMNQSQSMEFRQTFTPKNVTDKESLIETQVEAMKMTMSVMGQKLEYDSDHPEKTSPMLAGQTKDFEASLKKPATVTYDALGNVIDSLNLDMSQLGAAILQFPENEVSVGSKWNVSKNQSISGTEITVDYTYTVTAINKKSVDVSIAGTVKGSTDDISGNYDGTASINTQTGLVMNSTLKNNMSMTVSEQGLSIPVTMVVNTTIEVK